VDITPVSILPGRSYDSNLIELEFRMLKSLPATLKYKVKIGVNVADWGIPVPNKKSGIATASKWNPVRSLLASQDWFSIGNIPGNANGS